LLFIKNSNYRVIINVSNIVVDWAINFRCALRAQALISRKVSGASCSAFANIFIAIHTASTGKWYFSTDRCQERTPRMLDFEPQILETVKKTRQQVHGSCSWILVFSVCALNCLPMERVLNVTEFLISTTPIFRSTNPERCSFAGFGTIYIEGHSRVLEITTDILNIVSNSNNCKYGSCGFCFDFSFHLVFTLSYLTRFCGSVYLKSFSAISFIVRFCHSLFLKRFYGYSYLDLLEDSEPSRSGWNLLNWTLNLKCLTTF
jgi:hypothetical protein